MPSYAAWVSYTPDGALDQLLAMRGAHIRPLASAIVLLCDGWQQVDELIRTTTASRRNVQQLLVALGDDVQRSGDRVRIEPAVALAYRERAGLSSTTGADTHEQLPTEHPELLATLAERVRDAPHGLSALDHVQATPDTVLRRALWLGAQYDLRRCRLLLLGDHDLTCLAITALYPEAEVTVVDVDERTLAYLDQHVGDSVRTRHADLRVGLPPELTGWADLVFSDPPFTPEGMGLFAFRGLQALADPRNGRLLLAYGFSATHPTLGWQVQRALSRLGLTFESIVANFHRYLGAQAIGSAADLYVCQPTGSAPRREPRKLAIYTQGRESVDSSREPSPLLTDVRAIAASDGAGVRHQPANWAHPITAAHGTAVTLELTTDPGPWLLRVLLAASAKRVAILLPNQHPDLASAHAQAALRELIHAKYRLRFLRSTPDNQHAVVTADAVTHSDDSGQVAIRQVLTKAHGKLANTWREALIAASAGTLSKNAARTLLADRQPPETLAARLIDLPRHHIMRLLPMIAQTAAEVSPSPPFQAGQTG